MSAYAFYLRHVRGIRFSDCHFGFEKADGRPAFVVDDGEDVVLTGCNLQKGSVGPESGVAVRPGAGVKIVPPATGTAPPP